MIKMSRRPARICVWLAGLSIIIFLLNVEVTSLQGVNYKIREIRMPLYFKILDFFDRHYNYKLLTRRIIGDTGTDEEKVFKILNWTYANVRKVPPGFPVIDDHVWHIIVRGYGVDNQSNDVFTTLCNYAGLEAFFQEIFTRDRRESTTLSFVRVSGRWHVFDSYHRVYFKNRSGAPADLDEIRRGDRQVVFADTPGRDYGVFLDNIPDIKKAGLTRATIQSPVNRFLFELKKTRQMIWQ
ncbi:MAG: hypothetical protein Q7S07_04510 [Candidatus Omnitrophota bacterium]|nr:hypothetical protein [Candidatus Omnitrophota bacterium]